MIVRAVQRWRDRRDAYRPVGEVIRTSEYEVVAEAGLATVRAFVERHHYSGSIPAARWQFSLCHRGEVVGAAIFSHPCNDRVLTNALPIASAKDGVELGRFVLLDEVPANGESWFLARCLALLRHEGLAGVVSFADPEARTRADGSEVFPGHVGNAYQASNALHTGRGTARTIRILPDGTVFSDRSASKIRSLERGWEYCARQLVSAGADRFPEWGTTEDASRREWLRTALAAVTRPLRHGGCLRYVLPLSKATRRWAEDRALAYPKFSDGPMTGRGGLTE